jgi:probable F420-dependent oxidoreductase
MNFGIAFANAGPFAHPGPLVDLAQTAEAAGMESLWTVEHVVVPVGYKSEYPYSNDGRMPGPESAPIPDPILPLAYVAAVTEKIRLATGILILPQRHPLYVAKEMATLDLLSGGRAILGIGVGWLAEEFAALGLDFDTRAARTREAAEALRALWKEGPCSFDGKFFRWKDLESNPKPVQPGGIPIVIGGHTDLAAKRAARYGDGFFPGRGDQAQLEHLIGVLRAECERIGRNPNEIEITAALPSRKPEKIVAMARLGISRFVMAPPAMDRAGLDDAFARFQDDVVSRF